MGDNPMASHRFHHSHADSSPTFLDSGLVRMLTLAGFLAGVLAAGIYLIIRGLT
jgi:hypothetical protein